MGGMRHMRTLEQKGTFAGRFFSTASPSGETNAKDPLKDEPKNKNEPPKEEQEAKANDGEKAKEEDEDEFSDSDRLKVKRRTVVIKENLRPKFAIKKWYFVVLAATGYLLYTGTRTKYTMDDVRLGLILMNAPWADSPLYDVPENSSIPEGMRARLLIVLSCFHALLSDLRRRKKEAKARAELNLNVRDGPIPIPFEDVKGRDLSRFDGKDAVKFIVLLTFEDFFKKVRDPLDPEIYRYYMRDNAMTFFQFLDHKVDIFFWLNWGNIEEEKRIGNQLRNCFGAHVISAVIFSDYCTYEPGRYIRDLDRIPYTDKKVIVITGEERDYPVNRTREKIILGKWDGKPDTKLLDLIFFFDNILHVDFHPNRDIQYELKKYKRARTNVLDYWRPAREKVWGTGPGIVLPPDQEDRKTRLIDLDYYTSESP
eukprot:CAMPEP_0184341796 /NCGR_PEP_ID=MMETSP1089-20130417/10404_1 /TAXON_ID=38269 ORGANISM="Gloeochaete wittrockiana, Strain SAG46.84" /NCGR_SAMPLE_ID=MMETSP1089 /ASSEMBLY_ACC=CAM_ASM_000445 /LENGTH=424 /DNA_ID=CAMNT_0026670287 /DNA_START=58 /DNA_END=1328 /DNA_ORIENTATION=+